MVLANHPASEWPRSFQEDPEQNTRKEKRRTPEEETLTTPT